MMEWRRRTRIIIMTTTTTTLGCKLPLLLRSFPLLIMMLWFIIIVITCSLLFVGVVNAFMSSSSSSSSCNWGCHPIALPSRPRRHHRHRHFHLFSATSPAPATCSTTMPARNHTEMTRTTSTRSRSSSKHSNDNDNDDDNDDGYYDAFGIRFKQALLQDNDVSLSNKRGNNKDNNHQPSSSSSSSSSFGQEEEELSPYYRRDRRIPQQEQLHYNQRRRRRLTQQQQQQTSQQQEQQQQYVVQDPIALRQLLQDRYWARKHGDYERVARLDATLRQQPHGGIRVYDHPPIWSPIHFLPRPPLAHYRHRALKLASALQNEHGPKRHCYQYQYYCNNNNNKNTINNDDISKDALIADIVCSLSEPEIHTALSRLTLCRQQGRHEQADAIRFELYMHGIIVNDDAMTWSFSSNDNDDDHFHHDDDTNEAEQLKLQQNHSPAPTQIGEHDTINDDKSQNIAHIPFVPANATQNAAVATAVAAIEYKEKDNDDGNDNDNVLDLRARQRVEHLIALRANVLVCGNQQEAAFLALELYKTYHVVLDDDGKTWSAVQHRPQDKRPHGNNNNGTSLNNVCSIMPSFSLLSKFWPPTIMTEASSSSSSSSLWMMNLALLSKKSLFPPRLFTMDEAKSPQYRSPSYRLSSQSLALAPVDVNNDDDVNGAPGDNDNACTNNQKDQLQRMYMTTLLQERIQDLIQERIHRREEAKYVEADALRKELWYTYHVGVNDRLQQYSVGGVYDDDDDNQERPEI